MCDDMPNLTIGQCATLACLLEVSVPKPGNVHRGADFEDVTFLDFMVSAVAIGPPMEAAARSGVGATVHSAVVATRRLVCSNTNLGTVLLLAPLAAVPRSTRLGSGLRAVLDGLQPDDAQLVYAAIRLAQPGGMGNVDSMDIQDAAPTNLLIAMEAAADRDLVARQYSNGFATVLEEIVPAFVEGTGRGWSLTDTIIRTHLQLMQRYPDSLIARKCGSQVAQESADRAAEVLAAGPPDSEAYLHALGALDFWLRSDHHRRNPGTTADLIAAGLFAGLREGLIRWDGSTSTGVKK
jgi:triphosphoribosyl-dephospho-CoA synthase